MSDQPPIMPGSVLVSCTLILSHRGHCSDEHRRSQADVAGIQSRQASRSIWGEDFWRERRPVQVATARAGSSTRSRASSFFRLASPTRMVALVPSTSSR